MSHLVHARTNIGLQSKPARGETPGALAAVSDHRIDSLHSLMSQRLRTDFRNPLMQLLCMSRWSVKMLLHKGCGCTKYASTIISVHCGIDAQQVCC
jgi:hypothetical protein